MDRGARTARAPRAATRPGGDRDARDRLPALAPALRAAARRYGTPLYVTDGAALDAAADAVRAAFPDPWLRAYSLKANDLPALVARLAGHGFGANVVSRGEWALARRAGLPNAAITLEGIGKTDADLRAAVRAAAAGEPLRWVAVGVGRRGAALARIAAGAARPPPTLRGRRARAAQPVGRARDARRSGHRIARLQVRRAARTRSGAVIEAGGGAGRPGPLARDPPPRRVAARARSTPGATPCGAASPSSRSCRAGMPDFDTLDVGGGMPATPWRARRPGRRRRAAASGPTREPRRGRPGRSAVARTRRASPPRSPSSSTRSRPTAGRAASPSSPGARWWRRPAGSSPGSSTCASGRCRRPPRRASARAPTRLAVLPPGSTTDDRTRRLVVVDAGMTELRPAGPLRRRARRRGPHLAGPRAAPAIAPPGPTRVDGPICESTDTLGEHLLPPLRRGDLVAIADAGAYAASMRSTYNGRPRPAEVIVEAGRDAHAGPPARHPRVAGMRRLLPVLALLLRDRDVAGAGLPGPGRDAGRARRTPTRSLDQAVYDTAGLFSATTIADGRGDDRPRSRSAPAPRSSSTRR